MPLLFCHMHVISSAHASPWGQALPGCWRWVLKQVPFFLITFISECWFEFCSLRCMLEIKVKIIILVTLERMLPFLLNQLDFKSHIMMASDTCCCGMRFMTLSFMTLYRRQESRPSPWKKMERSKMAVWGGLTNSCEKKRGKKQRRKGKI